jgi:hypothetical protein
MPIGWAIDPAQRLVTIRYDDPYSFEEWREALTAVVRDASYERGFGFLIDRRFSAPPTADFAEKVAEFVAGHLEKIGPSRVAIVVSTTAGFGMGRMQQVLNETSGLPSRAFTSLASGVEWLRSPGT